MFDANILYYCYNNEAHDDFGVGYLGNKEFWIHLLNTWNRNDGNPHKYVKEEWEELSPIADMRGCLLAEIEYDNLGTYVVSWVDEDGENQMQIDGNGTIFWTNNPQNIPSIPRWVSRLKKQLRDIEK